MTRRDNVRSQLDAFEALGYLRWQPAIHNRWAITPAGGTLLLLNLREAELFVSGLATGSTSPSAEERRRRLRDDEQVLTPPDDADPARFAEKLDAAEQLLHDAEQMPTGSRNQLTPVVQAAGKLRQLRTIVEHWGDHVPAELQQRRTELATRARTALDL